MARTFTDHVGKRFGRLTVLRREDTPWVSASGRVHPRRWICRCDCGTEKPIAAGSFVHGGTVSCGCYLLDISTRHGSAPKGKPTPTYRIWLAMRERCSNPKNVGYHRYGGRGIKVCERWNDYALFLADVGERPPGLTLDRIDADKGYEPGNVKWATRKEQAVNRTNNKRVVIAGVERYACEVAEENGIPLSTYYGRLKYGWSMEDAVTRPLTRISPLRKDLGVSPG